MENNNEARVTQRKAAASSRLIVEEMQLDRLYAWPIWWNKFAKPVDESPKMDLKEDRHVFKNLINAIFAKEGLSNRLFVTWNVGIFMLDGDTAVASKYLLDRVKKVANSVNNTVENCRQLGLANGLIEADSRMLRNAAGTIDGNLTTLAGAIARMTSIPKEVKRAALLHLGATI